VETIGGFAPLPTSDIKTTQKNQPSPDGPTGGQHNQKPTGPDASQTPIQIAHQPPQAGKNGERKNAPPQMSG
jgi:hypothetical protein